MKKRGIIFIFVICNFLILFPFINADFSLGNKSFDLKQSYGLGDNVEGWVNISFNSQEANSYFKDGAGNQISLIELLKKESNKNFNHSCYPLDCENSYSFSNSQSSKSFNLGVYDEALFGFVLTGSSINEIKSFSFDLSSNATRDCLCQLKLDFFDNGEVDYLNSKAFQIKCSPISYSCFNSSKISKEYNLQDYSNGDFYCQRFKLNEGPGFYVGAWLKKDEDVSDSEVIFELRDSNLYIKLGNCSINSSKISTSGGEQDCYIEHPVSEPGDYYVCIAKTGENGHYIRGYSDVSGNNACGGYNLGQNSPETSAYNISIQQMQFAQPSDLHINESFIEDINFLIESYIDEKYENNCSNGCVIPIKIKSGAIQTISLSNLNLEYKSSGVITERHFVDLSSTSALVNSNYGKLYIDEGNFLIPSSKGNFTFKLFFNEESLIEEVLIVEDVPIINSLFPLLTYAVYPTTFNILTSGTNISEVEWNFGNNETRTTNQKSVSYSYPNIGTYNLRVTVKDIYGRTSYKNFNVTVKNPKDVVNSTIIKKKNDLKDTKSFLSTLDNFLRNYIEEDINIGYLEDTLSQYEEYFERASDDDIYLEIMRDLLKLHVPTLIDIFKEGESNFFILPEADKINLGAIEDASNSTYDVSLAFNYKEYIREWMLNHIQGKNNFKTVTIKYDEKEDKEITFYNIELTSDADEQAILFIESFEGIKFENPSLIEGPTKGNYYSKFNEAIKINFIVPRELNIMGVDYFISPSLSQITIQSESFVPIDEGLSRMTLFILTMSFILILGIASYLILQRWYKHKYEAYLFKDKNNLFNIILYIDNLKKQEVEDSDIEKNLKKSGWDGEQITYAMKKYRGKRTGMPELFSIDKIINYLFHKDSLNPEKGPNIPNVNNDQKVLPKNLSKPFLNKDKINKQSFNDRKFNKEEKF